MDLNLQNKVVLITGVNNPQGIGAATALAFAHEKAKLVLVYKKIAYTYNEDATGHDGLDRYFKANCGDAAKLESQLFSMNADYLILETDISDETNVYAIYDAAEKRFGNVDILINNAAVADVHGNDTIFSLTADVVDATFAINVKGMLLLTREFVKRRKERDKIGGRIINLSSDNAAHSFAGQITYGASKSAVESLTRSLASEVGKLGITVNAVAPGPTQTGWIDADLTSQVLPKIPLGRLGMPEDIAPMIVFLASDKASWITGETIKVCGGHVL